MKVTLLLAMVSYVAGRPEVSGDRRYQGELGRQAHLEAAALPVEARGPTVEPGVRSLEYYGGARGQHLLIYPDGRMVVTGKRRYPGQEEDVGTAPEGPLDSVSISQPPENSSVAEAKPVSIAIAGEGGIASAAPIGQAIVGPGGLAISRPVATAVAGVPGQEELVAAIVGGGKAPHGYMYSVLHSSHPNALLYYAPPYIF